MDVIAGRMTERLWKLSCGSFAQERLGEIFRLSFALGRQRIIDLIDGQQKVCGEIFF